MISPPPGPAWCLAMRYLVIIEKGPTKRADTLGFALVNRETGEVLGATVP